MKCKFCQAELESNSSVCPSCGKDNLKDDLKALKIVALSMTCLVMLVLLVGLVNFGVTGEFIPKWLQPPTAEEKFEAAMEEVVATLGEHKLTNRELQMYYWIVAYSCEDEGLNIKQPLDVQIRDKTTGQTYEEYFLEEALNTWKESMVMVDAAKKAGFEMPEEYKTQFDTMKADLDQMAQYYYGLSGADELIKEQFGPGCNYAVYESYAWNYYLGSSYWSEMMLELEVTDQEIEDYFTKNEESLKNDYQISITKDFGNLVDIRNILIKVGTTEVEQEDGTKDKVVTEQNWADCLAEAEKILAEWKAGEMTAEKFGELAVKYSKDSGSNQNDGKYADLYSGCLKEVDVRHILVIPEGGVLNDDNRTYTYTEEAWAAALAEAEALLQQWKDGEMTEESFGALANEHSDDQDGKVTNGGLYTDVYMGQMVAEFEDWCFDSSRQAGDTGIVKTVFGYHIMYFVYADGEADAWTFSEDRVVGDVAILKTDDGYQIIYIEGMEAAWYRYSEYGAKATKSADMLKEMTEAATIDIQRDKIVLGSIAQ